MKIRWGVGPCVFQSNASLSLWNIIINSAQQLVTDSPALRNDYDQGYVDLLQA